MYVELIYEDKISCASERLMVLYYEKANLIIFIDLKQAMDCSVSNIPLVNLRKSHTDDVYSPFGIILMREGISRDVPIPAS